MFCSALLVVTASLHDLAKTGLDLKGPWGATSLMWRGSVCQWSVLLVGSSLDKQLKCAFENHPVSMWGTPLTFTAIICLLEKYTLKVPQRKSSANDNNKITQITYSNPEIWVEKKRFKCSHGNQEKWTEKYFGVTASCVTPCGLSFKLAFCVSSFLNFWCLAEHALTNQSLFSLHSSWRGLVVQTLAAWWQNHHPICQIKYTQFSSETLES